MDETPPLSDDWIAEIVDTHFCEGCPNPGNIEAAIREAIADATPRIQAAVWREAAEVAGRKAAALQTQGARMDQWAPVRGVEMTCEARAKARSIERTTGP